MTRTPGATLLLTLLAALPATAQWAVTLPAPTGPHAVGATRFTLVDTARLETFTDDPRDHRELLLRVWYPAQPVSGTEPERFWGDETQEIATRMAAFLRLATSSFANLAQAPSHTYAGAPIAETGARFPVVVFSHGYVPGILSQNTAQMEELASHGYVVASIGHTYETLVTVFPDGRLVPLSQSRLAAFGQGAGNTRELVARYTATTDPAVKDSLIRRIAAGWPVLNQSLAIWAADTRFVLDELERMSTGSRPGIFSGKLDLSRTGIFGMSFGGATAGQVCLVDARCKAGINLDGLQFGDLIDRPMPRPFLFMQSEDTGTLNRFVVDRATGPAYYVVVKGASHFNFSDFSLLSPDFRKAGLLGSIEGGRMQHIMNAYVLAFFDKYLKEKDAPLLAGPPARFPEVDFTARPRHAKP
jgi:predicted dienelactone hydrolase